MRINKSLITYIPSSGAGSGTVTSVAMSVPTGFAIGGSPITSSGTLALSFASGYALPTTVKQSQWDDAYTFVSNFPTQTGNNGKYLKTNGSVLSWAELEIYATTPLVWTAGTSTMSINQASSGASGFLSSTDWSTFNAKLNNPLTTLGDTLYSNASGAAVRLAGNTSATQKFLSQTGDGFGNSAAPSWQEISAISIGAVPSSRTLTINGTAYDLSANRSWSVGTVTSVALTTTTSGISISGSPVTSSGNLNIEISTASGSANGLLSSSDWTSFNSRMSNPMTGANGVGDLIYGNAAGAPVRRAPNVTTTKMFLSSTGDGTSGNAPVWEAITATTLGVVPTTTTLTINGTSYDLSANRTWNVGTVTSVGLTTTTSGISISGSPVNSSGNLNIEIQTASGSQNGLLSSTDWTSFNSRMSNPMTSLGDLIYGNAVGAPLRRAGNTTTTKMFLSQTGDGTNSAAPQWSTVTASDTGAVPTTTTITINDVVFDLSANRSWSVGDYGTW